MSTLTSLYGSGGIPINGLAQFANAPVLYTDLDSKIWLKAGNVSDDFETYPDAISVTWGVGIAAYLQAFSVAGQETSPQGVFFKPDGTKMYVVGRTGDDVNEYDLSTAWNISTASFVQAFSVAGQETSPTGIFFKPDGTKMYVIGSTEDNINEYDLMQHIGLMSATGLDPHTYVRIK